MRYFIAVVVTLLAVFLAALIVVSSMSLAAATPGNMETRVITRLKYSSIGGKNVVDPLPDTAATRNTGAEHFQHHCQVCHGLDGQNTGVPFANKTSPPVADLSSARVQHYSDGQLKWIIDNGIRFTGMPGWKGVLEDDESWAIVRYIRHLPARGSLGAPAVFQEAEEEHEHAEHPAGAAPAEEHQHQHEHAAPKPTHR